MSRFYGFTYEVLINMDADIYSMYAQGMSELDSEELLMSFTKHSYTSMSKDDRKSLHRETHKSAFPFAHENPKNVIKLGDLSKVVM